MAIGKKQQLQAQAEAERRAREQDTAKRKPRIIRERPMIAPVAKPTKRITLSPIVQPIAMVPYNSEDESGYDYDMDY